MALFIPTTWPGIQSSFVLLPKKMAQRLPIFNSGFMLHGTASSLQIVKVIAHEESCDERLICCWLNANANTSSCISLHQPHCPTFPSLYLEANFFRTSNLFAGQPWKKPSAYPVVKLDVAVIAVAQILAMFSRFFPSHLLSWGFPSCRKGA